MNLWHTGAPFLYIIFDHVMNKTKLSKGEAGSTHAFNTLSKLPVYIVQLLTFLIVGSLYVNITEKAHHIHILWV